MASVVASGDASGWLANRLPTPAVHVERRPSRDGALYVWGRNRVAHRDGVWTPRLSHRGCDAAPGADGLAGTPRSAA
jgi:hypothetical protein